MNDRLRIGACLSLSGRFAQFGRQAAQGLETWRSLDGTAEILVEDDRSDRRTLETVLPGVAARCDILLGPYSTQLMRAAGRMAAESGWLVWNHGGSGDDVEGAHPATSSRPDADQPVRGALPAAAGQRAGGAARPVHRSRARQLRPPGGRRSRGDRAAAGHPHGPSSPLTTRSRHRVSRRNGISSARACSSKTPSWSARRFARPPRRAGCAP